MADGYGGWKIIALTIAIFHAHQPLTHSHQPSALSHD
jgi:hypothetical protein